VLASREVEGQADIGTGPYRLQAVPGDTAAAHALMQTELKAIGLVAR
jgi:hypothetical protein